MVRNTWYKGILVYGSRITKVSTLFNILLKSIVNTYFLRKTKRLWFLINRKPLVRNTWYKGILVCGSRITKISTFFNILLKSIVNRHFLRKTQRHSFLLNRNCWLSAPILKKAFWFLSTDHVMNWWPFFLSWWKNVDSLAKRLVRLVIRKP